MQQFGTDFASMTAFGRGSFFGDPQEVQRLAPNPSEENTFFGWPLLIGLSVAIAWMWRDRLVRALTFTGLVLFALSLPPKVTVYHSNTSLPGPMRLLGKFPIFDTLVPVRVGLFVLPVLGVLLALSIGRILETTSRGTVQRRFVYVACALALIPLAPMPLRVLHRPLPAFITQGMWKKYIPEGRAMVTLPPTSSSWNDGMRWDASTNLEFDLASGYFLGPGNNGGALFGPPPRYISALFNQVARDGKPAVITDADRVAALKDLDHWRASVVVLGELHLYWYNKSRKAQAEEAVGSLPNDFLAHLSVSAAYGFGTSMIESSLPPARLVRAWADPRALE